MTVIERRAHENLTLGAALPAEARSATCDGRTAAFHAVVIPANPIAPVAIPVEPCRNLGSFAIRYRLAITAENVITSVTAQTEPVT